MIYSYLEGYGMLRYWLALSPSYLVHKVNVQDGALRGLVAAIMASVDLHTEADGATETPGERTIYS